MKITNKIVSLLACAFIMPISTAQAVTPLDKASFFVGIAIPDSTTQIEFNNNIGGVPVDFNKDLGLETDNVIALLGATWRPWDNHQFGFAYFGNSGSNTKSLGDPIEWNGVVYDGTVETSLDFETYDFSYIWWGLNKENYAL